MSTLRARVPQEALGTRDGHLPERYTLVVCGVGCQAGGRKAFLPLTRVHDVRFLGRSATAIWPSGPEAQ